MNGNVREGGEERKKAAKVMQYSSVVSSMCLEWSLERRRAEMRLCGAHVTGNAYLVMTFNFNRRDSCITLMSDWTVGSGIGMEKAELSEES